jgi:hypothetical protein
MQIIVHFGIHKTASTYFQKEIFRKCPNLVYIPRSDCKKFNNYIISSEAFDAGHGLELFNEVIRSLKIELHHDTRILISNEDYYGNPFGNKNDTLTIIKRFRILFNDQLSVVALFRNQEMLIRSLFLQFIKTGGYATFNEFISVKKEESILNWNYLFFDRFALYLKENFSSDNYLFFTYEDFEKDKSQLLLKMCSFIYREKIEKLPFTLSEHVHNISLNPKFINASIFLNKFVKNYRYPDHPLPFFIYRIYMRFFLYFSKKRKKLDYDMPIPSELLGEISESNQKLDAEFKELGIFTYGYP